jgi:hypothetical protein
VDRKFEDRKIINEVSELDHILMFNLLKRCFANVLKVFSFILPHRSKVLVGASALATKSGVVISRSARFIRRRSRRHVMVIN